MGFFGVIIYNLSDNSKMGGGSPLFMTTYEQYWSKEDIINCLLNKDQIWWMLFQKRVVRTKFLIYVFIIKVKVEFSEIWNCYLFFFTAKVNFLKFSMAPIKWLLFPVLHHLGGYFSSGIDVYNVSIRTILKFSLLYC